MDCQAAHKNLLLDSNGDIIICCNNRLSLSYDKNNIETALHSKQAWNIRQQLDQNRFPPSCVRCKAEESQQGRSYRQDYNQMFAFPDMDVGLKTLHIQNDVTCNLHCIYCGPWYSSNWASLQHMATVVPPKVAVSDQVLANLEIVTLAGGEPSLAVTYLDLLQRLHAVNTSCEVIVNTNLTRLIGNKFFNQVLAFPRHKIITSFEAVGSKYEYIRHPAKWSEFAKNFDHLCSMTSNVQASMVWFPLSVLGIFDACEFGLKSLTDGDIFINAYHGLHFPWTKLSNHMIDQVHQKVLHLEEGGFNKLSEQFASMLQHIKLGNQTDFDFLKKYDKLTGQNHFYIFKELYV